MVATVETISEPELHSKRCGASISSAPSVVKKSSSMNSAPGIWNTLIHREAAEVNGGPTRINDQQFGSSDDLFIERSADSSGNALGFAPSSAITEYLYNQQHYDVISGQYYMRARNYDPATGTFTQQDTISIAPGDAANANLFLFAGADSINMGDPSGHFGSAFSLSVTLAIGSLVDSISLSAIGGAFAYVGSAVPAGAAVYESTAWMMSASPAAASLRDLLDSNAREVQNATDRALQKLKGLGRSIQELAELPKFYVVESLTPAIFEFDVRELALRPDWFVLVYNGPYSDLTYDNRAWVNTTYGHKRIGAQPGYQLDEFPFASTEQGGPHGPAQAEMVPGIQNPAQGGYLSVFYRYQLEGAPEPFLVVPVPI